ncbi:MAG: hypothetical protein ACYTFK_02550 [Planctomycetota bacterium]
MLEDIKKQTLKSGKSPSVVPLTFPPKTTSEGKIDFHACRVAYITYILEAGATVKEVQTLARHSKPELTLNTYARTRDARLTELTEKVASRLLNEEKCAKYMQYDELPSSPKNRKLLLNSNLQQFQGNGGGGIRTPVP